MGLALLVAVVAVASVVAVTSVVLLEPVGVDALLVGSSVGVCAVLIVVAADDEVTSAVRDVVGVGVVVAADEASVECVLPMPGIFSWQRAPSIHGGHMCGERQRSAVFDSVS